MFINSSMGFLLKHFLYFLLICAYLLPKNSFSSSIVWKVEKDDLAGLLEKAAADDRMSGA